MTSLTAVKRVPRTGVPRYNPHQMPHRAEQLAAVDLGSNSFHMLIARVRGDQLVVIDRMRERVALAEGFDAANNLTEASMQRGLSCLERFGDRLRSLESVHVRAVGTNTLRKAKNTGDFLKRCEHALGNRIDVISGREEGRIIYLGVAHSISDDAGRRLVIDIGGGSTECIIGERFEPLRVESLHMGCVSWSQRFFSDGRFRKEAFREATMAARVELQTIEREFRSLGWVNGVGASGTITGIEGVLRANGWSESGITRDALRTLREHLISVGRLSRLTLPGLSADRAPVLAGGLAILLGCFKSLKIGRMTASEGALREGLLYDIVGRTNHEDVRERTVAAMMRRFEVDTVQAARVEATALYCMRQVTAAWELVHPELERILAWGARLHEVGLTLSYSGHHQHGAYIVEHSEMPGFARSRQLALAALIHAHRRRIRPTTIEQLRALGGDMAIRTAVLLRLAATLHRSRSPDPLPAFELTASGSALALTFESDWLDHRPLLVADLRNEQGFLAAAGITFRFG